MHYRNIAVLGMTLIVQACTGFFFQPLKEHVFDPQSFGLAYHDHYFEAADGTRLHGWFFQANEEPLGSVLFLHGNAENISTHFANVAWLADAGFDVFAIDYRGYGRSEGIPNLDGLHQDAEAALSTLISHPRTNTNRIVVLGQSLGGAIALSTLARSQYREQVRALIIEGAFTDYREIAREKLDAFWLTWPLQWPISLTIDASYSPLMAATALSPLPLLIIHGDAYKIIPFHHGQALFDAAGSPKTFWALSGVDHIQAFSNLETRQRLVRFLTEILEKPE